MNNKNLFNIYESRREIRSRTPGFYEVRVIMNDPYSTKLSAYFHTDNPEPVIDQILNWKYPPGCCINWYMSVNPVKDYCVAREQFNNLRKSKIMTQDNDIERIDWLPLDIDADHPAGTSSTDAEKAAALKQAREVYRYMQSQGFDFPEVVDSGNGYHLKYKVNLPNDEESRSIISMTIDMLHKRFPFIDPQVKNPSRILKLPGTWAMKGQNFTTEKAAEWTEKKSRLFEARPFRMAYIIQDAGTEWKEEQEDNAKQ